MGDNIDVQSGFFSKKLASKEVDVGTSAATDLVHYQRMLPQHLNTSGVPQDVTAATPLPVQQVASSDTVLSRFLDTVGSGGGTKNANGNYAAAAQSFAIKPSAGTTFWIARLLICIEDAGASSSAGYGAIATPLTNGVVVRTSNASQTLIDLTNGVPVVKNGDWSRFCDDLGPSTWSAGNGYVRGTWSFDRSGRLLRLRGDQAEKLEVVLNDDLTDLVGHHFLAQGYSA